MGTSAAARGSRKACFGRIKDSSGLRLKNDKVPFGSSVILSEDS